MTKHHKHEVFAHLFFFCFKAHFKWAGLNQFGPARCIFDTPVL